MIAPGQVVEIRALDVSTDGYRAPHTEAGFFDFEHLEEAVEQAFAISPSASGVFFTPNPNTVQRIITTVSGKVFFKGGRPRCSGNPGRPGERPPNRSRLRSPRG